MSYQPPTQLIPIDIFKFPSPIDGCDCIICLRKGVDFTKFRTEEPSIFEPYHVQFVSPNSNMAIPCDQHDLDEFQEKHSKVCDWLQPGGNDIKNLPWHRFCSQLLRKILKMKEARVFKEPVDHIKHNLPDYPIHIRHPMDLGTIDRRLHGEVCMYTNPDDFVSDMRMVFRNAFVFNPEGNAVRIWAEILSRTFEEELTAYSI